MRSPGEKRIKSSGGAPRRRAGSRPIGTRILIVGEGKKTEPSYFRGLKGETVVELHSDVTVRGARGQSPESVVDKTVELKQKEEARGVEFSYDEVWCVLDVEDRHKRSSLGRAIKKAIANDVTMCLSNPCFEVWLLAHFEKKARAHNSARAATKALDTHWKKHFKQSYAKANERIYTSLADRIGTAAKNARWVREKHHDLAKGVQDCNSSTEVYLLVERMLKGKP